MNRKRDKSSVDAEVSFEGLVDLESIPPPASGQHDVHIARTAVAPLPHLVMAELQRAKEGGDLESQRTRVQPKFEVPTEAMPASKPGHSPGAYAFMDEVPTRPGKDNKTRPQAPDLHAALPPGSSVVREGGTASGVEACAPPSAPASGPAPAPAPAPAPEIVRDTLPTGEVPPRANAAAPPAAAAVEPAFPRPASLPSIPVHVEAPEPRRNWRRVLFTILALAVLAFAGAAFRRYRLHRTR